MKYLAFLTLFLAACNAQPSSETTESTDTVSTANAGDSAEIEEERTKAEFAAFQKEQRVKDSINNAEMSVFFHPLKMGTYDSLKLLLKSMDVDFKESASRLKTLTFGESTIDVSNVSDLEEQVCAATIVEKNFPLSNGLFIGMPKTEFLKITHYNEDSFTKDGETKYYEKELNPSGDPYTARFVLSDSTLVKFIFRSPCGMMP